MKDLIWETRKVKVKDLIQLDINPRKITEDKRKALIESLNKFNLVEIPAVNTDFKIIGGNQRVMALMLSGREEEEIDVRFPNRKLSQKEVKEYAIISNTHAGEFDFDMLEEEFADIDLSEIGFNLDGLDEWLEEKEKKTAKEAKEDDYQIPDEIKTDIVLGDLFEIGPHRLLCGDSTDSEQVARLMNGEKADMVFTDPPYNVAYEGGSKKREKIENDEIKDFYQFLYDAFVNCLINTKSGASVYIAHSDLERANFTKAFIDAGFKLSSVIVWVKDNSTFSMSKDYKWKHEPIIYGWNANGAHTFYGDTRQDTVWNIKRPSRSDNHPTMKPIELVAKALNNSSKSEDLIFEPFTGSGSTMVAAHQLDRKCYGIELDPKYCQVIVDRMIKLDPDLVILKNGVIYEPTN